MLDEPEEQEFREDTELHLKLQLADVFENFRNVCLENYEIDPCYTYSAPGLTWLGGLKHTGVLLKY